jgi:hypothetical protein
MATLLQSKNKLLLSKLSNFSRSSIKEYLKLEERIDSKIKSLVDFAPLDEIRKQFSKEEQRKQWLYAQ